MAQGTKQISNPGQAYSLGATWGTPSVDNAMTSVSADLINATGLILYTGDIVCLDVTGTQAVLSTEAGDPRQIGTVGSQTEMSTYVGPTYPTIANDIGMTTLDGSINPIMTSAVRTEAMGFTNGSGTVTDSLAQGAYDVGKTILIPYNSSTNADPLVYTVTASIAGTGYTVSPVFNGTTGTYVSQIFNSPGSIGPGWQLPPGWTGASAFPPNAIVPIVTRGFGRVNINGVSAEVATDLISVGNGTVVGARTAFGSGTNIGEYIAVTLEAYAARDTSLTTLGITGHDSVRAIIVKM